MTSTVNRLFYKDFTAYYEANKEERDILFWQSEFPSHECSDRFTLTRVSILHLKSTNAWISLSLPVICSDASHSFANPTRQGSQSQKSSARSISTCESAMKCNLRQGRQVEVRSVNFSQREKF